MRAPKLLCSFCMELIERVPLENCEPYKAAALEKEGVARSLLKESKGALFQEVITTMASFMALQMIDLKWPLPDLILSSPKDPINEALAKELSKFFDIPFRKTSNMGMCSDKILLVVDTVLSQESEIEIFEELAPSKIFQMGFVRV